VTIKTIATTKAVIASQLNGQVDIGAGSYVGYVAAQAAGARFRILAEASTLSPNTRVLLTTPARASRPWPAGRQEDRGQRHQQHRYPADQHAARRERISPAQVRFVTDKQGFPDMAGRLQGGQWDAAFLAEPYVTKAEEDYGQVELADLDQGATMNFPIGGYVATQAWARQHPQTAAAFVRAIEEGQALAQDDPSAARRPWRNPISCRAR